MNREFSQRPNDKGHTMKNTIKFILRVIVFVSVICLIKFNTYINSDKGLGNFLRIVAFIVLAIFNITILLQVYSFITYKAVVDCAGIRVGTYNQFNKYTQPRQEIGFDNIFYLKYEQIQKPNLKGKNIVIKTIKLMSNNDSETKSLFLMGYSVAQIHELMSAIKNQVQMNLHRDVKILPDDINN